MGPANDAFRFVLELCVLAALGYWGFRAGAGSIRWVLGFGTPLGMAVLWGLFMSPKAPWRTEDPVRLVAEIVIFGVACAALAGAGRPPLAMVLAAAVAVHLLLTFPLAQR